MAKKASDAASSIEVFADTCAKLALVEQIRSGMLRAAGTGEEGWKQARASWMKKLRAGTREGRELRARFLRAYAETADALGAPPFDPRPDEPAFDRIEPRPEGMPSPPLMAATSLPTPAEPMGPMPAPMQEVPTFLRPVEPEPAPPRGDSPWACTGPVDVAKVYRSILPFREGAAPSPLLTSASPPKEQASSEGTGTLPLSGLVAPAASPGAPTVALSDLPRPVSDVSGATVVLGDLPLPRAAAASPDSGGPEPSRPAPPARGLLPRKK